MNSLTAWLPVVLILSTTGCDSSGASTYIIDLSEDGGSNSISGRVTMPDGTPSGHFIQFRVFRTSSPALAVIEPLGNTNSSGEFEYRIVNAADGDYQVSARVDINDSGQFDTGDLDGYFDGTVDQPIQDDDLATEITLRGMPVQDVDFGIAPAP